MLDNDIIVGLDLDGCVFDYVSFLKEFVEKYHPELLPLKYPLSEYNFVDEGWFRDMDHYREIQGEAAERGLYANLSMYPGASRVLRKLSSKGFKFHIITSRFVKNWQHKRVVTDTVTILDACKIPYSSITFTEDKTKIDCDVFIDDAPHNLEGLTKQDKPCIKLLRSYNTDAPGIVARNWNDIEHILVNMYC